jgi:hypothetical protein
MEKRRPEDRPFRHIWLKGPWRFDNWKLRQDHAEHGTGEGRLDRAGT